MPSQGLFTALAGFGRGLVDEAEARRVREERARLQAAAELKDRLAQERQTRLDQQALTQQGIENTRADASTALSMNKGGFSPWQAGTVNGEEAATAQAWPTAPSTAGMTGSVLGAVAPVAQKLTLDQGIARAKQIAGAQGGYVKTGMSETERVREDDRAAKAEALQASLAQARELAQQRTEAENQRARESNQTRRDLAGIAAAAAGSRRSAADEARASQLSTRLRGQYEQNPAIKNAYTIANQLQTVRAAASQSDAASDLSLIYAYMKILDPNSVVRESEFATAEKARGVPDDIRNLYNRVLKGTRLTPEQRTQFLATATRVGQQARAGLKMQNDRYAKIAGQMGVDPSLVVFDPFMDGDPVSGGSDSPAPTTVTPRLPGESIAAYRKRTGG